MTKADLVEQVAEAIGPGITNADVLAATDYVVPCFEVVDSR